MFNISESCRQQQQHHAADVEVNTNAHACVWVKSLFTDAEVLHQKHAKLHRTIGHFTSFYLQ